MEGFASRPKLDLLEMLYLRICPQCGKSIPEGAGTGTGRKVDGLFCGLDCYVNYYEIELKERVQNNFQKQNISS